MAEITAQLVKQLRDKTNASMMKCKEALVEAAGDLEEAETILRKRGIEGAVKKASRSAQEGVISAHIVAEGRTGVLAEINCETDFVAKNDHFQTLVADLTAHLAESSGAGTVEELMAEPFRGQPGSTVEEFVKSKIAELGENLVVRRFTRYTVEEGAQGVVAKYIHLQGKVGVLVEAGCEKAETVSDPGFRELIGDLTLHITAAHPLCIHREEVPAALVDKEKEIYREQMKGKPDNIIEKILQGKIDKYFGTVCLLEQGFIKDPDRTVGDLLKEKGQALGDTLSVRRYVRYAVGEEI